MIEYIRNDHHGSTVFYQEKVVFSKRSALYEVKNMCLQHFFSYEGYIKSVRKMTKDKYQIPILIDEDHAFLPTCRVRDYENIWINTFSIYQIIPHHKGVELIFYSGRRLYIDYSINRLKNKIKLVMKIKSMKVNIFIFNHIEITSN
jgi:competence transcription factor ComK